MLVAQLADQGQLVLDQCLHRGGNALRPAAPRALVGHLAQVAGGRVAARHHLVRVLVLQRVQAEMTALRHTQGLGQQLGGKGVRQAQPGAQVLLGAALQRMATFRERLADARGRQHVLQRLARAHMHVHIAHGHQGQRRQFRQGAQAVQPELIIQAAQLLHPDPAPACELPQRPAPQGQQLRVGGMAFRAQQHQTVGQCHTREIGLREMVGTFLRRAPQPGDEGAQVAVALQVLRQHDQHARRTVRSAGLHPKLRSQQQMQAHGLCRHMGAHGPGQTALVGQGQCPVAQRVGALHQLVRMARATQEGEVRDAAQFRIVRQ